MGCGSGSDRDGGGRRHRRVIAGECRTLRYGLHRGRNVGRGVDHELEALRKTRLHVADIATLVEMARAHLEEGRFEDASACLRLIEQHAALGREGLGGLLT